MSGFTGQATFITIGASLQAECARRGLVVPGFRARPSQECARTIKRCPNGVVVNVRLDRDPHTVAGDLIDGVIAANPALADDPLLIEQVRAELWTAAGLAVAA